MTANDAKAAVLAVQPKAKYTEALGSLVGKVIVELGEFRRTVDIPGYSCNETLGEQEDGAWIDAAKNLSVYRD